VPAVLSLRKARTVRPGSTGAVGDF
jgi:hypothetical protein